MNHQQAVGLFQRRGILARINHHHMKVFPADPHPPLFVQKPRSEDTLGLRYTTYVGDGDSSSFSRITQEQPYGPDVTTIKEECVGHIQKRMGCRLRKLVEKKKGVKLADGKTFDEKGRLHRKRVDLLQGFYGKALRTNKGNPEAASAETMAGLYHYAGDHSYCPTRNDTWCNFKKDEISGTNNSEPVDDPFTPAMVAVMKPIMMTYLMLTYYRIAVSV
ncbi:uncharacterized protein [Amphiura filiformis]